MDMIAHIYGWIGLCGWQIQMEEKPPVFSLERSQQIRREQPSRVYIKQWSSYDSKGL